MTKTAFTLLLLAGLGGCATEQQIPYVKDRPVEVSPEAMVECKLYEHLPVQDMTNDQILEHISYVYSLLDTCHDKQKILADFILGMTPKANKGTP